MNLWILAATIYLIAMLCVFAFVRGASRARNGELYQADDELRPTSDCDTTVSKPDGFSGPNEKARPKPGQEVTL